MSTIKVSIAYMEHEGGTKFYEVATYSLDSGRSVVVNRWGKMSAKRGGEIKIESYAVKSQADAAARKKINEKGGRGYNAATGSYMPRTLNVDSARLSLAGHYSDTDTVDGILTRLGIDDVLTEAISQPVPDEIVTDEPKPEPERGGEWASW